MLFFAGKRNGKGLSAAEALIDRLNKETEEVIRLQTALNQAVEDIKLLGSTGEFICPVCAHYNHGEGTKGECVKCLTGDGFRWRGEKDDVE